MAMSAGNVQVCSSAPEESSISVCFESSKHKTPGRSCQLDVNRKSVFKFKGPFTKTLWQIRCQTSLEQHVFLKYSQNVKMLIIKVLAYTIFSSSIINKISCLAFQCF